MLRAVFKKKQDPTQTESARIAVQLLGMVSHDLNRLEKRRADPKVKKGKAVRDGLIHVFHGTVGRRDNTLTYKAKTVTSHGDTSESAADGTSRKLQDLLDAIRQEPDYLRVHELCHQANVTVALITTTEPQLFSARGTTGKLSLTIFTDRPYVLGYALPKDDIARQALLSRPYKLPTISQQIAAARQGNLVVLP